MLGVFALRRGTTDRRKNPAPMKRTCHGTVAAESRGRRQAARVEAIQGVCDAGLGGAAGHPDWTISRVPRAALEDWIAEHTQHASGRTGDAGPLFVGMQDREGVLDAGPSPPRGDPQEPMLGPRRASRKASSGVSS